MQRMNINALFIKFGCRRKETKTVTTAAYRLRGPVATFPRQGHL